MTRVTIDDVRVGPEMKVIAEGTVAGGESGAGQLLGRPAPPTAVLVETDEVFEPAGVGQER
jgi:hypothetical protein